MKKTILWVLRITQILSLLAWFFFSQDPGPLYFIPILSDTGIFPVGNLINAFIFLGAVYGIHKLKIKFGLIGEKQYF